MMKCWEVVSMTDVVACVHLVMLQTEVDFLQVYLTEKVKKYVDVAVSVNVT